jgi:outer membrane protein OmpA-like peptidoglycan-associated protein
VVAAAPPKAPEPAPVTATPASPVRVASAAAAGSGSLNAINFGAGTTELPTSAKPALDAVAAKLVTNDALRVQVVAHATGGSDQAIEARRISLARAVAVRGYLIDKGVRSLRIDVRALGNRADDAPAGDQVDLVLVNQ